MENVKFINIVFENCESIVIPIKRVKRMEFGILTPFKNYPFKEFAAFDSEYTLLEIIYLNESDLQYNGLDYDYPLGMFIDNPMSNNIEDRPNILGRIMNQNDLVKVELLDNTQRHIKYIYVPWDLKDKYENRYMSKEANKGILKIEVRIR